MNLSEISCGENQLRLVLYTDGVESDLPAKIHGGLGFR